MIYSVGSPAGSPGWSRGAGPAGLVLGLLADLPRKNCWSVAEHAGDAGPRGMQRLLSAAVWDHDGVLADVRDYVVERLGDTDAVMVVDETGDLTKGAATVGVHRQYTGTAGKVDNAQVAVYLAYASPGGCAFIDRALYLPRAWTDDHDRCAAAGVPDEVGFVTKPQPATRMIARALDAGVPAHWVAGDEVYGADPGLRAELAGRGVSYVLAVAKDHRISTAAATVPAADWARMLRRQAWQPLSAGHGAKGHRVYNWALIDTSDPAATSGCHWLLIRRHRRTGELPSTAATHPDRAGAGDRNKSSEHSDHRCRRAGLPQGRRAAGGLRWRPWERALPLHGRRQHVVERARAGLLHGHVSGGGGLGDVRTLDEHRPGPRLRRFGQSLLLSHRVQCEPLPHGSTLDIWRPVRVDLRG
jgi:hypothetical protein